MFYKCIALLYLWANIEIFSIYVNSGSGQVSFYKVAASLYFHYPFSIVMFPLQLLVTAILIVTKKLLITAKASSYVAELLFRYILSEMGIAMLKCSTAILKALKKNIKRAILYPNSEIVTIPRELYQNLS